jgi:hypothetical protein
VRADRSSDGDSVLTSPADINHPARERRPTPGPRRHHTKQRLGDQRSVELLKRVSQVRILPGAHDEGPAQWDRLPEVALLLARARATPVPLRGAVATETWRMQFGALRASRPAPGGVAPQPEVHAGGHRTSAIGPSELATNAVQHGHVPGHHFEVALTSNSRSCLIEVSDASPRMPKALTPTAEDERGRGLRLVSALSA